MKNNIRLLDCTLRDGGYINNWDFGYKPIVDMIDKLEQTKIDILEVGFLKNEDYDKNRTVFNKMNQISALIPNKKKGVEYAAMIEVVNPIPLEMVAPRTEDSVDIIRVIVWKTKHDENGKIVDALQEGYEYCKGIVEKGYKLCVQPARVDQYSDEEFIDMLNLFQQLNPLAIYVVDSWGTQSARDILHYVGLADKTIKKEIAIGYHGHNNLMQAYGNAIEFVENDMNRDVIVDASVYGIGRGAGNLNLELFAKYLNDYHEKNYAISPMNSVYDLYIKSIYEDHKWGYSIPYYLTAQYNCNPNYGEYYDLEKHLDAVEIETILAALTTDDKVMYSKKKADDYIQKILNK